ncbi:prolyl oligopeptidase family serine peptidase [Pendulispora albinea]|uniref:prolyl oligopeptidase n=1 Tax=Pendulispora albinea TaxID=2741071 RepID=A0ABZ2M2Y1_9BACT
MTFRVLFLIVVLVPVWACRSKSAPIMSSASSSHKPPAHEPSPPVAPVRPVLDTYFGVGVTDRYRWMENDPSPEYGTWLAEQNQHARRALDRIVGRSKVAGDIRAITRDVDTIVDIQDTETSTVLSRKPAGAISAKLYVRDAHERDGRGREAGERLVFDPPGGATLDGFTASPDGRFVIVLTSSRGTEERTAHVLRTEGAQPLPDRVERLRDPSIAWLPGARSFVYTRYPEAGKPDRLARYKNAEVCVHAIGTDAAADKVVFGGVALGGAPDDYPVVALTEGSPTALGIVYHGVLREISLYVKPLSELESPSKWQKLAGPADAITEVAARENELYLLSFHGADRGRVLRLREGAVSLASATTLVPEGEDVLEQIRPARDGIFTLALRRGVHRLAHVSATGERHEAPLPAEASVESFRSRGAETTAVLRTESYVTSPVWMRWEGRDSAPVPVSFNPRPMAFAGVRVERTVATSSDGTAIPLTLLVPQGAARDGKSYVWLLGYGAGGYSLSPKFYPYRDAWLKRGGVWAIAHIRGGGELGAAWHRAGMKGNKERSIDDFLACAEKLVKDGYTTPQRMVANGRSAGAIVAGGAMTRRPDLFRAVVLTAAGANMLRLDTSPVGAENAREFGSTSTQEGFEALLKMDTVQRVRDGQPYPALLLQTGANDPKLPSWHSGKLAARVQAASTSGRPVLLSVAANQGHHDDTAEQVAQSYADAFSFAFSQLGHPDFPSR